MNTLTTLNTLTILTTILLHTKSLSHANEIKTNAVTMTNTPAWLKAPKVEQVTARIQQKLEWSIRRIPVNWYKTQEEFDKAHTYGPQVLAVTKYANNMASIHMGPRVTQENFNEVFGHELVHVIISQKYKTSIPQWLEEGLANHLANQGKVDYKWLAQQPFPNDVTELAHPFAGTSSLVNYRYKASQALAEMLNKKCNLENLIRLSVQRKMENYVQTYCRIKDLAKTFKEWVLTKAKE